MDTETGANVTTLEHQRDPLQTATESCSEEQPTRSVAGYIVVVIFLGVGEMLQTIDGASVQTGTTEP